jgi:outer membrane immunogenic protein
MKKHLALGIVAAAAFCGAPAFAADMPTKVPSPLPPAPTFSWTGFYIGANGGAALWDPSYSVSTPSSAVAPFFAAADAAAIAANGSGNLKTTDATFGGQIGYNYQIDRALFGAEVDWGRGPSGSVTVVAPTTGAGTEIVNTTASANSLVTLRARLGYVFDRSLFYVTGGAAYSTLKFSQTSGFAGGVATLDSASISQDKWGWTLGGGAEYALDAHWSVKAEYLYVNFGSITFVTNPISPYGTASGTVPFTHNVSNLNMNLAKLGLNYRF